MKKLIVTEKGQALIEEISNLDPSCFGVISEKVALAEALWGVKTTPFRSARYFSCERPTRRAVINRLIGDGYLECAEVSDKIIQFLETSASLTDDSLRSRSTEIYVPPECGFSKKATELLDLAINEPAKIEDDKNELMLVLFMYADPEARMRIQPVTIFQLIKQGWLIPAEVEEEDDFLSLEDLL